MQVRTPRRLKESLLMLLGASALASGLVACQGSQPQTQQPAASGSAANAPATEAEAQALAGQGAAAPSAEAQAACATLIGLKLKDTVITDAKIVAARGNIPEHCRVAGGIEQVILFEVGLPTKTWNGKFYYSGGGGYNGTVPSLNDGLSRNYASTGSDTGHRGEHWDASALLNKPQVQVNYAHRGAHLTTVIAKEIVKAYYNKPQERSYFMGCSNGGKMGLMAVQRYPEDFDGVVAGGYVADRTKLMLMFDWTQRALLGSEIPPRKIAAMEKATLAACDAVDGLKDGLIDRPDRCTFDPAVLTCEGPDGNDCLTPKQVEAWRKILDGPRDSKGKLLYPGYSPGHESDYPSYITGTGIMHGYPSSNFMYMDSFMRWVAFNPGYDSVREFDYDRDPQKLTKFAEIHDAYDADLTKYSKHGGKLILYNGWADHSTPPRRAVEYFEEVKKVHGADTDKFVRAFLPPGLYHCNGGPGPNIFGARGQTRAGDDPDNDILAALDQWVTKGRAPEKIVMTKYKNDDPKQGVQRTRPTCAYPQVAKYKGSGSVDEAANFVCASLE